ncbi:MAG: agmatine deiminase family protein [Bacteroidales bacterium]|nr:agmatine deiminase family protein [Bacteroidales bacterium]HPE87602.1 agmatine deiminase family protein [Bacteroidales bacterium]
MRLIQGIYVLIFMFTWANVWSQTPLKHTLSDEEKALFYTIGKDFYATDPPSGEVRNIAEFEPAEGVLVRYPFGIPITLIAEIAEDANVITLVANQSQQDEVIALYTQNGVDLSRCDFIQAPTDSYWTRDYGPWFIMTGNSEVAVVNFPYNRPRPNDNDVPIQVAQHLNLELYGMNLIHTGGNWMTDGMGQGAQTNLVLEENPSLSQTEVNQLVDDYLGITINHIVDDPLGDYIKHVDCWGKFLGPDKILIGQVPQSDARYQDFEDAAAYWASSTSSYGTPYRVFRVFTPGGNPATPYTNSYIINKKVFIPLTGSQWDDEAITSYTTAMPGYEIIGIPFTTWENTDALHCRTHEIADREMLYIQHLPLLGHQPMLEQYTLTAAIYPLSGMPVYPDSVVVNYRINSGQWNQTVMVNTDNTTYTADIPFPGQGFSMLYYIHAADASGRSENHPYIGRWEPHTFSVPAPGKPQCVYPPAGSFSASPYTNLQWSDAGLFPADSFCLSMGTDNPPGNLLNQVVISGNSFLPEVPLAFNTTYYWQVTAMNGTGAISGDIWSFSTLDIPDEDFETGDFSLFDWVFSGEADWTITGEKARNGQYSVVSGPVDHNESSVLSLELNCTGFEKLIWWGSTSCEENDSLLFSVDGIPMVCLSGESYWQEFRQSTGPGLHHFEWKYKKNAQGVSGADGAYIDFIWFPSHDAVLTAYAGEDGETCADVPFPLAGNAASYNSLLWTSAGDGQFDDPTNLITEYLPGNDDINTGLTVLTLTAYNFSGESVSDALNLTVRPLPETPSCPSGPDTVYTLSHPSSTFFTNLLPDVGYEWHITPDAGILTPDGSSCEIEWTITEITSAEVVVKSTNSCGESEWSEAKAVYLIPDVGQGTPAVFGRENIQIVPNPSNGRFYIQMENPARKEVTFQLYDAYGRTIMRQQINSYAKTIFISNLCPGMYVLQVRHEKIMHAYKVVIR